MSNTPAVTTQQVFNHVQHFRDYRKTIYEASDQTIKSNHIDIKLFRNFLDMKNYHYITGKAVMDFSVLFKTTATQQRGIDESQAVYPPQLCQISKIRKYPSWGNAAIL